MINLKATPHMPQGPGAKSRLRGRALSSRSSHSLTCCGCQRFGRDVGVVICSGLFQGRQAALAALAACAFWLAIFPAVVRSSSYQSLGYTIRVWQTEDGLPQNAVAAITQTSNGYIWVASFGGLARFDGARFEVFDAINTPELWDARVVTLFEDSAGVLWIGHELGAISRYQNGHFETFNLPGLPATDGIRAIAPDEKAQLWALRENGSFDSISDHTHAAAPKSPFEGGHLQWTRMPDGTIAVARDGQVITLQGHKTVSLKFGDISGPVSAVAASADKALWVLANGKIRKWNNGRWTEDRGEFIWGDESISCCQELRDGTLAIGTVTGGLYLIFPDQRNSVHFDRTNGLPQNWIRCLFEDREGTLWLGAGGAGLVSIHTTPFSVLKLPNQWEGQTVLSVAPGQHDSLWIGTEGAGLFHYQEGRWSRYGIGEGLENPFIWAVTEGADRNVSVGCWMGGLFQLNDGRFVQVLSGDSVKGPVQAIIEDSSRNALLVGARDGLLELRDGQVNWLIKPTKPIPANVCAVVRQPDGTIWCGLAQGGLVRIKNGAVQTYGKAEGLPGEAVQCVWADADGSLWIGTGGNGLARQKNGHFSSLGTKQGLVSNVVGCLLDDSSGNLWIGTNRGIQRVSREDLNRCADGEISGISGQIYDRDDGLPSIEFSRGLQAAGCRTADGRLWFTSNQGVVTVDPRRIHPNATSPPVLVESLMVDGKDWVVQPGSQPLRLAPENTRIEFRYTGLSYVAPDKVLFKYRLEGLDQAWNDAGARRSASYSHLPAGNYRFRVVACNNDGLWNFEGATLAFSVAPYFWQTWWFLTLLAFAASAAVAGLARHLTRRRLHRQMLRLEQQHAIERERARIARDIHDDIGTSITRIAMLTQSAPASVNEPERAAQILSRIYTAARDVTRSLDEIVWAVDPRHDTLESMIGYFGKFAQDFLGTANIRCRLDAPVQLPQLRLTAEIRHNLFLALKEALNNAVKHATATEIRLSFSLTRQSLQILVKDNGRGFESGKAASTEPTRFNSGNGFQNMKARLARIEGDCQITSEIGKGTAVLFVVKLTDTHAEFTPPPQTADSAQSPASSSRGN